MRAHRASAVIAASLVVAVPSGAHAQLDAYLMFGARIGARSSQDGTANVPDSGARAIVLRESLTPPWMVSGVRLGYALQPRLAVEFGYTATWVQVSIDNVGGAGGTLLPATNGMVHTFALRPRARVGPLGVVTVAHIFAGPVLTWRTGGRFNDFAGTSRLGWNVGLGATLDARELGLRFRADLEDVIYALALHQAGVFDADRTVRHDILLTVGISLLRSSASYGLIK